MQIELNKCKTILVVSPHLDDGVLSLGGLIEKGIDSGSTVLVGTIFTADTPADAPLSALAEELHDWWKLGPNPYDTRRREDIDAVEALGARVLHGNLLDALYRNDTHGTALYPDRAALFSELSAEDPVSEDVARLVEAWIHEFKPDLVLGPLGVGRHVDHVITTRALRQVAQARGIDVALYEDMPYSTGRFPVSAPDSVEAALNRTAWKVNGDQVIGVNLDEKLKAISKYASQIAEIFPNGLLPEVVVGEYMRLGRPDQSYHERIWLASA